MSLLYAHGPRASQCGHTTAKSGLARGIETLAEWTGEAAVLISLCGPAAHATPPLIRGFPYLRYFGYGVRLREAQNAQWRCRLVIHVCASERRYGLREIVGIWL